MSQDIQTALQTAVDDGILSPAAQAMMVAPDIGKQIAAGFGGSANDVQTAETILIRAEMDDSSSMNHVHPDPARNPLRQTNAQVAAEGHNLVLDALLATQQKSFIHWSTGTFNKGVITPFTLISKAARLDDANFRAEGITPLYFNAFTALSTVLARATDYNNQGIPTRTITWIVTDGADYLPQGDARRKVTPDAVADLIDSLNRQEGMHIVMGLGIDDGYTDFRAVFHSMGLQDRFILTPENDPHAIRQACQMVSQSAVQASQGGASFSQVAQGGLGSMGGFGVAP